jgi:hypothetical protein
MGVVNPVSMGFARDWPLVAALATLTLSGAFGCDMKPEPQPPFSVVVRVQSDPGHPLSGATVMKGGREGPKTGADGTVQVNIPGIEGETVDLSIKCPSDYVSPLKPIGVLLRRNAGGKLPEYNADCPPAIRHMVVAVRADNGGNLPVTVLDHVIGYTDGAGAFTYAVPLKPGDGIEMKIDTTNQPLLKPQNPTKLLTMASHDDVVTFDQKFQVTEVKKVYHAKAVPQRLGPRRGF